MKFKQAAFAIALACATFAAPAFASEPVASCQKASPSAPSAPREGSDFISGAWNIAGSYTDGTEGAVNFSATFATDGTFVDRDNYRGRWIISGASFTMFYPDESELGYVGTIQGREISGLFFGRETNGQFRMSR